MDARPLQRVSPSLVEVLRLCFLRVYFSRTGQGGSSGGSPSARLGNAAHEVLAAAAQGRFAGLGDEAFNMAFAAVWDATVAGQDAAMQRAGSGYPGTLAQWRSFETVRALTRNAARHIARAGTAEQYIEHEFSAADGAVHGTPDRVARENGALVIEDYKTGAIYEESDGSGMQLKESHRRQVLLYAVLVAETLGEWPQLARVAALDGQREEITIDPAGAMSLVKEATGLLHAYNERLSRAVHAGDLASPAERACGSCAYQPWCEPYWQAATSQWAGDVSIEGRVDKKQSSPNGGVALRVQVQHGTVEPGPRIAGDLDPQRFPVLEHIGEGSRVRLTKLRPRHRSLVAGWFTGVRIL